MLLLLTTDSQPPPIRPGLRLGQLLRHLHWMAGHGCCPLAVAVARKPLALCKLPWRHLVNRNGCCRCSSPLCRCGRGLRSCTSSRGSWTVAISCCSRRLAAGFIAGCRKRVAGHNNRRRPAGGRSLSCTRVGHRRDGRRGRAAAGSSISAAAGRRQDVGILDQHHVVTGWRGCCCVPQVAGGRAAVQRAGCQSAHVFVICKEHRVIVHQSLPRDVHS